MTRPQIIMEKGMITFKHNSCLKFREICWQPTVVHKCEAIIRLFNTPLQMCRGKRCKPTESLPVLR